jgi:tail tube protein/ubiquitin-activating enzyme E1-like protein
MTTTFRSDALTSIGTAIYIGASVGGLPTGSPKTITGITAADPGVVTSNAHGLLEGDVGTFAAIVGMTQLNGTEGIVGSPDTNTFEIAGVDTTDFTAYTSGGTFTPFHMIKMCELRNFAQTGGQAAEIDVTTLCSTAIERRIGLQDYGEATLSINYVPGEAALIELKAAAADGQARWFKIVFPGGADTMVFQAFVRQISFTVGVNEAIQGTISLRLTGPITDVGVEPLPEPTLAMAA